MTPKKIKTQTVEKSDYKIFLKKAKDFYNIMLWQETPKTGQP